MTARPITPAEWERIPWHPRARMLRALEQRIAETRRADFEQRKNAQRAALRVTQAYVKERDLRAAEVADLGEQLDQRTHDAEALDRLIEARRRELEGLDTLIAVRARELARLRGVILDERDLERAARARLADAAAEARQHLSLTA